MREIIRIAAHCLFLSIVARGVAATPTSPGSSDPELTIQVAARTVVFTRSTLISRHEVESITVDDVSYGRPMTYRAITLNGLLRSFRIEDDATVEFVAEDGFASTVSYADLRNTAADRAIGYLAIEEANRRWPPLPNDPTGGGPFYLVWKNPQLSNIAREQWPYHVARIVIKGSLERLYPAIQPAPEASNDVRLGYEVFVKNCLPCHQLNGAGPSRVGADLNVPLSPTEYFRDGILQKFVRNPRSVFANPAGAMSAFPDNVLSDTDLDRLLAYLSHMAAHKVAITRP